MTSAPAEFKRILVPVDFSTRSANALEFAVALGSLNHAQVDVLHVWHSDLATAVTVARDRAKAELRRFVAELALRGDVALKRRTDHGDPYLTIQSVARLSGYDLVVVAGPEPGPAKSESVARDLLRASAGPVLFVPAQCKARLRSDEQRTCKFERIFVPLSLSGRARQAVSWAEALARHDGATLELGAIEDDLATLVKRVHTSSFDLVLLCEPRAALGERSLEGQVEAVALSARCATLSLPE